MVGFPGFCGFGFDLFYVCWVLNLTALGAWACGLVDCVGCQFWMF